MLLFLGQVAVISLVVVLVARVAKPRWRLLPRKIQIIVITLVTFVAQVVSVWLAIYVWAIKLMNIDVYQPVYPSMSSHTKILGLPSFFLLETFETFAILAFFSIACLFLCHVMLKKVDFSRIKSSRIYAIGFLLTAILVASLMGWKTTGIILVPYFLPVFAYLVFAFLSERIWRNP